jgi:hypothetical protein
MQTYQSEEHCLDVDVLLKKSKLIVMPWCFSGDAFILSSDAPLLHQLTG